MSAPTAFTCPDIDSVITLTEAAIAAVDALNGIVGNRGLMEELRAANEQLRKWGEMQEDRADALESELAAAKSELSDAECEMAELRDQLSCAESA